MMRMEGIRAMRERERSSKWERDRKRRGSEWETIGGRIY